ncbi:MAG: COX15/CtaA family protein [Anaerolineales bacterium]|nr:COX15/CtaA family protein [Anaerolineales bacterium]
MINRRYANFAWGVLVWNVIVIIWGAFVRATGSGAGCGSHWPLCKGALIPAADQTATLIEFSHRISSGLALLGVVALLVWALRAYPKGHPVRIAAIWTMIFMIIEALIGAALVLLEYVAFNVSIARAFWMAGHLVNTFLLLGALTLTAWWASGGDRLRVRGRGVVGISYWLAVAGIFVLGMSGAITALGDTLSIAGGISPQENAIVGGLVQMRVFHPLIAFAAGALVLWAVWSGLSKHPTQWAQRFGWSAVALFGVQLVLGAVNVALKAPVWVQLLHLLLTSVIWILFVLYGAVIMARGAPLPERDPALKPVQAAK